MKQNVFYNLGLVALLAFGATNRLRGADAWAPSFSPETNVVTLDTLVSEALEKNPELKFYEAELLEAKGERRTAGQWADPELSGNVGQKRVTGSSATVEGLAWSVSVTQPFEWPGRIGLRKAIANRDIELAQIGLERFRSALAGRVRTLGYTFFAAQEKAAVAREVADRFRALREVLVQRDPAGVTPLLEARVIEATELAMQRKASGAALAANAALLELNQLRGMRDARSVVAQPDLAFGAAGDVELLLALARTNNFDLRVRTVELAQQGFKVDLAKNERFPALSVGPTISEENAGDRERIIGVGLSLPLPLWNRNAGSIEAAKARQMQAEVSLGLVEQDVYRKVVETTARYETKRQEMNRWRPDSVQQFRDAAELADRHYRLGAVPISTYVELQKEYLEAVEALVETRKEALEAAAELELLTGVPVPVLNNGKKEQKP